MINLKNVLILFVLLTMAISHAADIEIVKTGAGKTTINITGIKGAGSNYKTFMYVLKRNLQISGWFSVGGANSALKLEGNQNGLTCSVVLKNQASGYKYFSRKFTSSTDVSDLAHQVVNSIVRSVKNEKGIADCKIVFIGENGGKKDIYVSDLDGGRMYKVTSDRKQCYAPKWSPDGNSILYTSLYKNFPDVYKINIRNRRRERLISMPGLNCGAVYSPDGTKVAVILSRDGNPELYVMDAHSKKLKRLTKTQSISEASPSWSPDGSQIVYVSDSSGRPNLYIINAAGGRPRRISYQGTENVTPDWGNNGKIAYISRLGGRYQLAVYDPRTGTNKVVTNDGADYENPSWTPDGKNIVVARTVNYKSSIYIYNVESKESMKLIQQAGSWSAPDVY